MTVAELDFFQQPSWHFLAKETGLVDQRREAIRSEGLADSSEELQVEGISSW